MAEFSDEVISVMEIIGATACAIIDIESGECLARAGIAISNALEAAGLVNARMLRAKLRMCEDKFADTIEDILITLNRHYHLIRLIHNGEEQPRLFLYLVLQRSGTSLAIARRKLAEIEQSMIALPNAKEQLEAARLRALCSGSGDEKVHGNTEELPAFMRDDVALKILGITLDGEDPFARLESEDSDSL